MSVENSAIRTKGKTLMEQDTIDGQTVSTYKIIR